nr:hypothetical protein FVER53263_00252 [Fusarium verticillioides]
MASSAAVEFPTGLTLHRITSPEKLEQWTPSLTQLLLSCVNDDPSSSSIGFHAPLSTTKATEFWSSQSPQLFGRNPRATLFVLARDTTAVGTISLVTHPKETHSHKVEVGKLLVSSEERGHGLGRKLMDMVERFAKEELGKKMVLLDTASDTPARGFYLKLGYTEWGVCPQYAESADGHLHDYQTFLPAAPTLSEGRLQSRLRAASIAEKMSWASKRKTTRTEDTAYCLLGIFGINMPLLYGEGTNAFLRLQEEIMKRSDDQTILAWDLTKDAPDDSGVLATSPAAFENCKAFIPCDLGIATPPFQITNKGLRIEMPVSSDSFGNGRYGLLQCRTKQDPTTMIAIPLASGRNGLYVRSKRKLLTLSYQYWGTWSFAPVNLLPSPSFASSIARPPSYTVFLKSIPKNFYIAEVYAPNEPQQPDPRIIMIGTPEDEDKVFSRVAFVLIKSSVKDEEQIVVRILIESVPKKGPVRTESQPEATVKFVKDYKGTIFDGVSLASSWDSCRDPIYPTWMRKQDKVYKITLNREYHFGKSLFVLELTEEDIKSDAEAAIFLWIDEDDFLNLPPALRLISYSARTTVQTVALLLSTQLGYSHWSLIP